MAILSIDGRPLVICKALLERRRIMVHECDNSNRNRHQGEAADLTRLSILDNIYALSILVEVDEDGQPQLRHSAAADLEMWDL